MNAACIIALWAFLQNVAKKAYELDELGEEGGAGSWLVRFKYFTSYFNQIPVVSQTAGNGALASPVLLRQTKGRRVEARCRPDGDESLRSTNLPALAVERVNLLLSYPPSALSCDDDLADLDAASRSALSARNASISSTLASSRRDALNTSLITFTAFLP